MLVCFISNYNVDICTKLEKGWIGERIFIKGDDTLLSCVQCEHTRHKFDKEAGRMLHVLSSNGFYVYVFFVSLC